MLEGKFIQTASGRKSFEVLHAKPEIIFPISKILVHEFGCTEPNIPTVGLDTVVTECYKDNIKLNLGWDIWSGFYIFADSVQGDKIVDKIGNYLIEILSSKKFEEFIDLKAL
jgi:hypothetical protein